MERHFAGTVARISTSTLKEVAEWEQLRAMVSNKVTIEKFFMENLS
jgi:hypothetical protein